ncbi:Alpha/Beta hydrolase protein [Protomyces lactucae-debilis]|uniref:Alpha/Beta hydrolase protein n=1 Tax=Protomyces lactucae-debilis TaxID=2754530 RepID=A0A1Y2ERG7_PROLT|nr:Alpha/Beta hydrolase protein [Protomyces lactucae-debilis]ORY74117.1 Alpha/Beta hydrolase protein [Protomyces lactucae-debilis]
MQVFLLRNLLGAPPNCTVSIPDCVSLKARSEVIASKDGHRELVMIPARPDRCINDAVHDAVQPEACPGFWSWANSVTSPHSNTKRGKVFLYFVGGAYVAGHPLRLGFDLRLSEATGLPVFSVNFRKACHLHLTFPAALQDAVAGFFYLLDQGYKAEDIIVCGDSAGGGLSVTLCLYLQKEGFQVPGKAFLVSPWVDLCVSQTTYNQQRLRRDFLKPERLEFCAIQYTWHRRQLRQTLLSPVHDTLPEGYSFKGFPKTFITYATDEVFFDEDEAFAKVLMKHGVDVEQFVQPDDIHVYCVLPMHGVDREVFKALKVFALK